MANYDNSNVKVSEQVVHLFEAMDVDDSNTINTTFLVDFLGRNGLGKEDPRLRALYWQMGKMGPNKPMSLGEFNKAIAECFSLVYKCLTNSLRVPDFDEVRKIVEAVYQKVEPNKGGNNADYIPQLAKVDPEQFAISITTTDGQHFSIGDSDTQWCIQSCSKPISYLLALDKFGEDYVHNHVGTEPSGRPFNEMVLKESPSEGNPGRQIPHNPCINAGAIMTVSMVEPDVADSRMRLETVLDAWRELSAADKFERDPIGYCCETYKSESSSANRNWCLAYMMLEKGAYPGCFERHQQDQKNLSDTLELYFQLCSILSTNRAMSVMAATLANGGLNPWSEKVVCSASHVRCVLPVMLSSGMYDYSGQWAYEVGVPAKSGVGGGVFMVVPNVCGIAVWSPRLNKEGNTVRGVAVASELVKSLQLHGFEVFSGCGSKMDPRKKKSADKDAKLNEVLFAASLGDVSNLQKHNQIGTNLFEGDYDNRTALHLAATEGHAQCLQFLVDCMPAAKKIALVNTEDRWHGTPLDDAEQQKHQSCVKILQAAGATKGKRVVGTLPPEATRKASPSEDSPDIIAAAQRGDLDHLIKLNARGIDLSFDHHDYDLRTPLHLASSNSRLECVKYLLYQAQKLGNSQKLKGAVDRWGHTALDDATREGNKECQVFLASKMRDEMQP